MGFSRLPLQGPSHPAWWRGAHAHALSGRHLQVVPVGLGHLGGGYSLYWLPVQILHLSMFGRAPSLTLDLLIVNLATASFLWRTRLQNSTSALEHNVQRGLSVVDVTLRPSRLDRTCDESLQFVVHVRESSTGRCPVKDCNHVINRYHWI